MAQMTFREAQATRWKANVESEVQAAKETLIAVEDVLKDCDGEDDILNGIKTAGDSLTSLFGQLISTFSTTLSTFANVFGSILAGIQAGMEAASNYKNQHC